jgi:uncharacterized protein
MGSTDERTRGGPVELADRAQAPDLARGVMLLLIALAHAPAYLFGRELTRGGYPAGATALDQGVVFAETTVVVGRVYPMFAALLGYGLAQLWARHLRAGADPGDVRRLVRRRGAWLVVFGFAHAALLWAGDILGAYGVVAVLLGAGLLRARGRVIAALAGLSLAVVAAGGAATALSDAGGGTSVLASTGEPDPLAAAVLRLGEWAPSLLLQPLGTIGAVLAGIWAGRRRLLDEPERHVRTLRQVAAWGLAAAFAGAVPWAVVVAGWWPDPAPAAVAVAGAVHAASGYGGVGYAAAVALLVARRGPRVGLVRRALVACGRRSLTCYLLQSVVFVAVLAAYGGGLGQGAGAAVAAAVAVATWLLTVAVAAALERAGARGPAEAALRRLTYRGL